MPVPAPELGSYNYVPETKVSSHFYMRYNIQLLNSFSFKSLVKANLDWADLITVDLSLYHTPEGKQQLAQTLIKAVREDGFFYVKGFNISQERVNRQFAIGKQFYETPLDEKLKYVPEGLGMCRFFLMERGEADVCVR